MRKCISYNCKVRERNGRDKEGNQLYFCKEVGIEVGKGQEECLLNKFAREIRDGK